MWNVNSTERGGGVAEMLRSLLGYAKGGGLDARWLVIQGDPEFFDVTKRVHNRLHGSPGDGGSLGDEARAVYERTLSAAAEDLAECVASGDVVILHDPQTAGLVPAMRRLGATVIWRCHVGTDVPSELASEAWAFLLPSLAEADAYVFSRRQFVPRGIDIRRTHVIPPSIDAFSPKNRDLDEHAVSSILSSGGVIPAPSPDGQPPVAHRASMVEDLPVPSGAPVVAQVSRWDRLKDPAGVIVGFAAHVAPFTDAHLIIAGPSGESIADDPEGSEVLAHCTSVREGLEPEVRARVHLACLPMQDPDENALMVNALQRHAAVVVQKSLAEGFGLTVAEAMWKARPVVASRVGGIQDQVDHGRTGLLVDDPADLAEFGQAVRALLLQHERAEALGRAAQESVRERFLAPRHLRQYADLLDTLVGARRAESPAR
jgi:trehalose synthase